MSCPPDDEILLPNVINPVIYSQLVSLLLENETWKIVAEAFGVFSSGEIKKVGHSKHPAETLIFELGSRLCTLEMFCEILQKCHLYNILMLFKEHEPIHILQQPSKGDEYQTVKRGLALKLSCVAEGLPPPTYQWYCNNEELEDGQESILCVNNFGIKNEGEYYCMLQQNGYGSILSNSVIAFLAPEKPVIVQQPSAHEICQIGEKVTLLVVAEGHPQLKYQWYKGNTELYGSVEPSLSLFIESESQGGIYRCYIYNSSGEVWSDEIKITICKRARPSAKIALLIGNQSYKNLHCLQTPENDIKSLADIFRDLGFYVIALQNLRLFEMRNFINYFSEILPKDAYVIFYFSGHGFETCDKFMLPVDVPGPEEYLHTHGLCERELLQKILSSGPMLLFEILDMCLKPPDPSNRRIYDEKTNLHEYQARSNLIQAYATTSYLSAYETKSRRNGLYVEYLTKAVKKHKEMPILEILREVGKEFVKLIHLQVPFFGTNVIADYRLTDPCDGNFAVKRKIDALSLVPESSILHFNKLHVKSKVSFSQYLGIFMNTLHIRLSNLENYSVSIKETEGEVLNFELCQIEGDVVIKVKNIDRLTSNSTLTFTIFDLFDKNGQLTDTANLNIGKPLIAAADLWREMYLGRIWPVGKYGHIPLFGTQKSERT